jgi:hypothetical protein
MFGVNRVILTRKSALIDPFEERIAQKVPVEQGDEKWGVLGSFCLMGEFVRVKYIVPDGR